MDTLYPFSSGLVGFMQNSIGITVKPYETYRRISRTQNYWELCAIGILSCAYFATASIVKTAAFRPYLLTKHFLVLGSAAACTYLFTSSLLWWIARRNGGNGTYSTFAMGWAYTLVPTLVWFWATSLLYVALPPPRTASFAGIMFSLVYLVFSATLLYWKIILAYLALRFSMRLDLKQITVTVIEATPILLLYGYFMYVMRIFRVPFI